MRKNGCVLLAAVCLLTFCFVLPAAAEATQDFDLRAAFEGGALALREIKLLHEGEAYTMRVPASWENAYLLFENTAFSAAYSEDGDWITFAVDGSELDFTPGYLSPDGGKMICLSNEGAYLLEDHTITMVAPDFERSVEDTYGSFADFLEIPSQYWIHQEGIVWSPDNRYAVITNYQYVFMRMKLVFGLYVIDTQTAGLLCLDTYPQRITEGAASVVQACFDNTGRYLYYVVYGNIFPGGNRQALMRYDLETGEKQTLLRSESNTVRPRLQADSRGRLWNLRYTNGSGDAPGLNLFTQDGGTWTASSFLLPRTNQNALMTNLQIGSNDTGAALVLLNPSGGFSYQLPVLFALRDTPENFDQVLLVKAFDAAQAERRSLTDLEQNETLMQLYSDGVPACMNIQLSPDGRYALMLMRDRKQYGYLMVDTETLALCPVKTPDAITSAITAYDSAMHGGLYSGFAWFSGNRFAMAQDDGVNLYELYVP